MVRTLAGWRQRVAAACLTSLVIASAGSACGDATGPESGELTGRYVLTAVTPDSAGLTVRFSVRDSATKAGPPVRETVATGVGTLEMSGRSLGTIACTLRRRNVFAPSGQPYTQDWMTLNCTSATGAVPRLVAFAQGEIPYATTPLISERLNGYVVVINGSGLGYSIGDGGLELRRDE